jgi:hypothetical protein
VAGDPAAGDGEDTEPDPSAPPAGDS